MNEEFEGMEKVNVRTMWPHEALDFTPWLAENLDLLGKSLGKTLTLEQRERPVGPYFLDILAREADTSVLVAIENQLERSDVGHLGQLITYATGCGANVAIWVAPEFEYEMAEALNRLNMWTTEGIEFYGVKIEVYQEVGNSCLKPRLSKVVSPNGWNKELTLPPIPPMSEYKEKYFQFYRPLINKLVGRGEFDNPVLYCDHNGRLFHSRVHRGIGYCVSLLGKSDTWVTLEIRSDDRDKTNRMFDRLFAKRNEIEQSINAGPDAEWEWNRHDKYAFSSISIKGDGSIDDSEALRDDTRAWMREHLIGFKEYFDSRLDELLSGPDAEKPV